MFQVIIYRLWLGLSMNCRESKLLRGRAKKREAKEKWVRRNFWRRRHLPCHQVPHTSAGTADPPARFCLASFPCRLWKRGHASEKDCGGGFKASTHLTSGSQLSFNAKLADVWRTGRRGKEFVVKSSWQWRGIWWKDFVSTYLQRIWDSKRSNTSKVVFIWKHDHSLKDEFLLYQFVNKFWKF